MNLMSPTITNQKDPTTSNSVWNLSVKQFQTEYIYLSFRMSLVLNAVLGMFKKQENKHSLCLGATIYGLVSSATTLSCV